MDLLIKKARIIDPDNKLHLSTKDILISKGRIEKIAVNISSNAKKITSENLCVSIGWMDIGTGMGEPGYEHRETKDSLEKAAIRGGYTAIAPFPNTSPIIQSAADIGYLKKIFENSLLDIYPIGALSKNCTSDELTEMNDMVDHGAVAFSNGLKPVENGGLLLRALQYASSSDTPIITYALDDQLSPSGQIHEGLVSLQLGLPGIPDFAEVIQIDRNIKLCNYADGRLIIHGISTAESIELIKKAKKKLGIASTVPYLNLISTHNDLSDFNVNFKVIPPLRSLEDQKALLKAVKKGNIDVIISNHVPLESEVKMLEFPYASAGAIGLETCFPALCTQYGEEMVQQLIPSLSSKPRAILNLDIPKIKKGEKANLTLWDPTKTWSYNSTSSLSSNNPFLHQELTGKVIGVINGSKAFIST